MEEDTTRKDSDQGPNQGPKRGVVFLVAIILGLLIGVLSTLLVMEVLEKRSYAKSQNVIQETPPIQSSTDTIVKYVIHKYELKEEPMEEFPADSLAEDSTFAYDEYGDLFLDDAEPYVVEDPNAVLSATKLLDKSSVKVIFLDNDKKEQHEAQLSSLLQVQIWESPIRNKQAYQFDGSILKLMGFSPDNLKLYSYKNNLYLIYKQVTYILRQNDQFERMEESMDLLLSDF